MTLSATSREVSLTARDEAVEHMLGQAGWSAAERRPLAGDASTRRYQRLHLNGATAVLMDAPPAAETPTCPPDADEAERIRLGYNAMARLAGPNAAAFAGLASELTRRGFSAPKILGADMEHGFILLEDLGDELYARAIERGADPHALYGAAIDLLGAVRRATLPSTVGVNGAQWIVQTYDHVARQAEADLLVDWYAPFRMGAALSDEGRQNWHDVWAALEPALAADAHTLNLRDVHAENLIWLPERDGPARAGLLDFQDALFGHPAYDLVSLLEDARRDVDPKLADNMIDRYVDAACIADKADFLRAYRVLGAQRNAKILGIFVRLAERDGKRHYLAHLPRVARHFVNDISHPDLADLRIWAERHIPSVFQDAES